jgi:hypothetical protein
MDICNQFVTNYLYKNPELCGWSMQPLRLTKVQPVLYFVLGPQPIVRFMAGLATALFKELVGTFADQVRQTFDGTAAGIGAEVFLAVGFIF